MRQFSKLVILSVIEILNAPRGSLTRRDATGEIGVDLYGPEIALIECMIG